MWGSARYRRKCRSCPLAGGESSRPRPIFVDLRDREGITQIVFDPSANAEAHKKAEALRSEWVIGIRGKVKSRGEQWSKKEEKMVSAANPDLPTGEIEVEILEMEIFNKSETPPFDLSERSTAGEDVRLAHRYLDLRRKPLQDALRTRAKIAHATRNFLSDEGATEVETPFLVKYTPGGARNFLFLRVCRAASSTLSPSHPSFLSSS